MCSTALMIALVRDMHRRLAELNPDWEMKELSFHLAIEAEKYLRRHEGRCTDCEPERKSA